MPKPHKGETQQEYISRAIPAFIKEGFTRLQAMGRAHGFWRHYKKK